MAMEIVAACEQDYLRLAVEMGIPLAEAQKDWNELITIKEDCDD